jgi:hypothetical protein
MHRRTVSAHRPELPGQATSLYEKFTTAVQLTDEADKDRGQSSEGDPDGK